MTSPTRAPAVSPTIGQAVGQAEASLTRVLTGILAERGTSRETYLGVQRLTSLGGQAAREDYERDLSEWLELAAADAGRLAGQLAAAGLTETDGGVTRLTPAGRALRAEVLAESAKITGPLLATLDPADVADHHPHPGRDHQAGPADSGPPEDHGGRHVTTAKLPGTDAARHGTGDADLTIMLAAHDAFRRDLTRLAAAAAAANLSDPARRQSVAAGWDLLKRELHLHHTAEDEIIWPVLRPRLARSPAAQSVLDAMEAEHERIDPLLAAVDAQFAGGDRLADVIDALTSALTGHLGHEERDGLPLIGMALTAREWRAVGRKIASKNGLSGGSEMFAWMLDGADRDHTAATLAQLPPPCASSTAPSGNPATPKPPAGNPPAPPMRVALYRQEPVQRHSHWSGSPAGQCVSRRRNGGDPGRLVLPGTAPRPPCRLPAGPGRDIPAPPHVSLQDH